MYKTFTSCVVMPLLWFCSLAALCAASRRGTAGTMGSQWHSRIRWRSQLRLHTSLAVTPLCWHLDTLTSKTNFSRPKIVGNVCETTPKASPGCRRHWASMSERQIAPEASPQIRTHWFLRLQPIIFQDCEASPNPAVLLGLQATNDTNIHLTAFHQKLGRHSKTYVDISSLAFWTFHIDPSFVGSVSFLTTQETGATWGAADVQQCQRLPWQNRTWQLKSWSLIWQKSYRNWCPIYKNKSLIAQSKSSNLLRRVSSMTQVSSPLQDSLLTSSTRTSRVLQPTSDAQSRLCDFHQ